MTIYSHATRMWSPVPSGPEGRQHQDLPGRCRQDFRMEFEVEDEEGREEFIRKAKAATCLAELPFMTEGIKDTIDRGMEWGRENSVGE